MIISGQGVPLSSARRQLCHQGISGSMLDSAPQGSSELTFETWLVHCTAQIACSCTQRGASWRQ